MSMSDSLSTRVKMPRFRRLECYTEVPPTNAMTDITGEITVEVLKIIAIATKEMRQDRASVLPPRKISQEDCNNDAAATAPLIQYATAKPWVARAQVENVASRIPDKLFDLDSLRSSWSI
jgi:hypothetical protein